MAKQAVVNTVSQANTFDQWRVQTNSVITKTNNQEDYIGDLALLSNAEPDLVSAVNETREYSVAITIALG
ncbi:hypothetical protein EBU71_01365 [bacterium]|jgi:hypothetical protein|nr:hypothetical protein [Candidatus Elulimicrobium humile]